MKQFGLNLKWKITFSGVSGSLPTETEVMQVGNFWQSDTNFHIIRIFYDNSLFWKNHYYNGKTNKRFNLIYLCTILNFKNSSWKKKKNKISKIWQNYSETINRQQKHRISKRYCLSHGKSHPVRSSILVQSNSRDPYRFSLYLGRLVSGSARQYHKFDDLIFKF